MTNIDYSALEARSSLATSSPIGLSPGAARGLLVAIAAAGVAAGFLATDAPMTSTAVVAAGDDLTRLLRFMAAIKALMAVGVVAAIVWRLGVVVRLPWLVAYGAAAAAMAAGPGLIWTMAHVGLGAVLLHGGLAAGLLTLWFDPAVAARLEGVLARRRTDRTRRAVETRVTPR